jgi:hypothetical protein
MNDVNAIVRGNLANKSIFGGTATAEILAVASTDGGWNSSFAYSVRSDYSWARRGGYSSDESFTDIYTFGAATGGTVGDIISHRTILSGY